jgi:hypothetical protein
MNERTNPQPNPLVCPAWCTAQHHRPDYLSHARDVLTIDADALVVGVTLAEHAQPGYSEKPRVRVYDHTDDETGVIDLAPDVAARLGWILTSLSPLQRAAFGRALTDAAALLLTSGEGGAS